MYEAWILLLHLIWFLDLTWTLHNSGIVWDPGSSSAVCFDEFLLILCSMLYITCKMVTATVVTLICWVFLEVENAMRDKDTGFWIPEWTEWITILCPVLWRSSFGVWNKATSISTEHTNSFTTTSKSEAVSWGRYESRKLPGFSRLQYRAVHMITPELSGATMVKTFTRSDYKVVSATTRHPQAATVGFLNKTLNQPSTLSAVCGSIWMNELKVSYFSEPLESMKSTTASKPQSDKKRMPEC